MSLDTQIDSLGEAIIAIADKLGIAATEMYRIYVGAQKIHAIVNVACAISWFVLTLLTGYFLARHFFASNMKRDDAWIATIILTIVISIGIFVVLVVIDNSLIAYFAPEYSGLKEMISTFKGFMTDGGI